MKCNQNIEKLIIILLFESTSYSNKFKFKYLGKGPWPKRLIVFASAGFAWVLWTCKNRMAIEKRFPKAPADVIYVCLIIHAEMELLT